MLLKSLLATFFVVSLLGAFVLSPQPGPSRDGGPVNGGADDQRLRLLTWNIGNGDLESETRAHTEDLTAVAQVILDNDPDAVAIQELTGEAQLKSLMSHLKNRYRGYVCTLGNSDRTDAVLVKNNSGANTRGDRGVRFTDVPTSDRFAAAATFSLSKDSPKVVLISAHADAFSASRRRAFAEQVVDWAHGRADNELVFIAGDFNFEVSTRNKSNLFTDNARHDSETYAYLLKYFRDLGHDAGETSINDRRIDYVFGPTGTVTLRRAEVLRGAAVGRMDHWPLLVEVGL